VFPALVKSPSKTVDTIVHELNLVIDTDEDQLSGFIDQALAKFPDKVTEYNKGKKGVLGLFMGELMKLSGGKIDPKIGNKLLIQKLESLK
jgi:aspartyl-tRNA(Asn)/glutamyl-tRNA(Gln) amidotransferase subunit B